MKITLLVVGKTSTSYLKAGIEEYVRRLAHYVTFDIQYLGDFKNAKNASENQQKTAEGRTILSSINTTDHVILLDEKGQEMTSVAWSQYLQRKMSSGIRRLVFVVGGPYGFSEDVYSRANGKVSLSLMTFSHEMVRLIFVEQLYRAFTILNHEPYHHQ